MSRQRISRLVFILFVSIVSGCAQFPSGDGSRDEISLLNAIVADQVEYVKAVVSSGAVSANARIPAPAYAEGTPLITIASREGSLKVLGYLISAGADVNARTPVNETALMLAVYFYGTDRQGTPKENFEKAARMLVEAGALLENDGGSYTPLSYAAYQGNEKMVRYLLERGARVNADARNGVARINTPLMMAAMQGHKETTIILLRAGADARIRVHGRHTASELAEKYIGGNLIGMLKCAEQLRPGETFAQRCDGSRRAGL
ncbi:MAG: ankyrin repeat domain-containing protein [Betaproteobacteria bacterium]|nr:ankyrin repeat domain-containing protein [Betaproteobacteria bacterium]